MPLTDEKRAWAVQTMMAAAEAALGLHRHDLDGNEVPLRERADELLGAASGNRKIEPRHFQLAWFITRTAVGDCPLCMKM